MTEIERIAETVRRAKASLPAFGKACSGAIANMNEMFAPLDKAWAEHRRVIESMVKPERMKRTAEADREERS